MVFFNLLSVTPVFLFCITINGFSINSTGGSFPTNVYRDATFAYQFLSSGDFVTYFGSGSTTGKCNIMGYWHTGDSLPSQSSIPIAVKIRDTQICTDTCTITTCGVSSTISPRFDRESRLPLIDFAGTDSVLKASDYTAFPDLLMLPALAGAAVPVYNIPELANSNISLILSRQNVADIFKGKIINWNDSDIVLNNPSLKGILSHISSRIRVVVRTDSSGTSEIFSTALSLFDPIGISSPDYSFGATVGFSSTPSWCGLLTDEIQMITIKNCDSTLSSTSKIIHMKVLDGNRTLRNLNFACDSSAMNVTREFLKNSPGPRLSVLVKKEIHSSGITTFQIGYSDVNTVGKMWYKPSILYAPPNLIVSIKTFQEGGYYNSHYNSVSYVTPQIQSIWISSVSNFFLYNVTVQTSKKSYNITLNSQLDDIGINIAFTKILNGSVSTVVRANMTSSSEWIEYRITLSDKHSSTLSGFGVITFSDDDKDSVYIMTMLDYNNYPNFYDSLHPTGFRGSGR